MIREGTLQQFLREVQTETRLSEPAESNPAIS
jgi:hypothetical protein